MHRNLLLKSTEDQQCEYFFTNSVKKVIFRYQRYQVLFNLEGFVHVTSEYVTCKPNHYDTKCA